jgi:hypothetical protein
MTLTEHTLARIDERLGHQRRGRTAAMWGAFVDGARPAASAALGRLRDEGPAMNETVVAVLDLIDRACRADGHDRISVLMSRPVAERLALAALLGLAALEEEPLWT